MGLFEHRYYRLNKHFMSLSGMWPYQSTRTKLGFVGILVFVAITGIPPLLLAIVRYRDDWTIVIDCLNAFLFVIITVMKWFDLMWNSKKWPSESSMQKDNNECRSLGYTPVDYWANHDLTMIYCTIMIDTTQPPMRKIIDVILKNGTEVGKFPYAVDYYYFDEQKYYWLICIHFFICECVAAIPVVASDHMLIIYVYHVCGVFAALGRRLERIGNGDTSAGNGVHLRSFIDKHNDVIEYANLIEASYTWNLFFIVGVGTIRSNLIGLQILKGTNDYETTIRFMAVLLSVPIIFCIYCYFSQMLANHSINVAMNIYNSQWYTLSTKDHKFLQLMIMRCHVPCQLTAGKMLIMSMRNYAIILRTAMSYFAVVRPK